MVNPEMQVLIGSCNDCPLAHRDDEGSDCQYPGVAPHFKDLPSSGTPEWCPLRAGSLLVTLNHRGLP